MELTLLWVDLRAETDEGEEILSRRGGDASSSESTSMRSITIRVFSR